MLILRAHAKGIILFNSGSVVWIEHSIPKFPPKQMTKNFSIDSPQLVYGQSMICLSLPFSALAQIGLQLYFARPQVYDYFIPNTLAKKAELANLLNVVNGLYVNTSPYSSVQTIKTVGNVEFVTYYKSAKFNDDLYSHLVASDLQTNLLVETWRHGPATNLPPDCTDPNTVNSILSVNFSSFGVNFSTMSDHSKWAVNQPKTPTDSKIVCIGDINRQSSQETRGGGTICFKNNEQVWTLYNSIVNDVEPCPAKK